LTSIPEISWPQRLAGTPKVSVLTITYNHEPFVAQCIASVMGQQTTFPVEMVIGEDCSPDRTRAICREYQQRHSDRIRLLLPERNVGRHANFRNALAACRGEYVALIEAMTTGPIPPSCRSRWICWNNTRTGPCVFIT